MATLINSNKSKYIYICTIDRASLAPRLGPYTTVSYYECIPVNADRIFASSLRFFRALYIAQYGHKGHVRRQIKRADRGYAVMLPRYDLLRE